MNRIKTLAIAMSLICFASCANEFEDPKVVADNFLERYVSLDYEGAKKYATDAYKLQLELESSDLALKSEVDLETSKKSTATINNVDTDEENGTSTVSYEDGANPGFERILTLEKIEDKWLVNDNAMNIEDQLNETFSEEEIEEMLNMEDEEEALPIDEEGELETISE